jgi:hypothetical protein
MTYSGKVIRIMDNEAIVMTKDFEVVRIKLEKEVKTGEDIYFLAKDIIVDGFNTPVSLSEFSVDSQVKNDKEFHTSKKATYFKKKKSKKFFNMVAISASFILIFVLMQFFISFNGKEYTYMDVDINPSFSFILDDSGIVDSIKLLNEDAAHFVEDLELKKVSFADGLKLILNNYKSQLSSPKEETVVFIAIAFSNPKNYEAREKELLDELMSLNEIFVENEIENTIIKAIIVDEKTRREALEHEISMGKYAIYQQAKNNLEISLDVVREKKVCELLEFVDIHDNNGAYALIEFDMMEEEFTLQETAASATKLDQLEETPKSVELQETPVETPKSVEPQETPVETSKSVEPQETPVETPKLVEPQETPVETSKSVEPQKTPTTTPQLWKPLDPTPIPQIIQAQEDLEKVPQLEQSEKTPEATPKLTQLRKRGPWLTPEPTPIKNTIWVLEDWENGDENKWYGPNISVTNDWAASGNYSLRSRVTVLNKSKIIVFNLCNLDFTGQNTLCAVVKEEKSKLFEGKISAKLFIRTGDDWKWTISDFKNISTSNRTILKLDLSEVPNLDDVKSIGIEFYVSSKEKGLIDLYVDYLYLE